jgi:hypothetical protein
MKGKIVKEQKEEFRKMICLLKLILILMQKLHRIKNFMMIMIFLPKKKKNIIKFLKKGLKNLLKNSKQSL